MREVSAKLTEDTSGNEEPPPDQHADEELPFEEALERLEEIVQKLDEGDLPLEDSIEMFEEGMRLKKTCLRRLNEAEAVVEQYTEPENQQVDEAEPDNNNDDSECKQEPRLEVDDQ